MHVLYFHQHFTTPDGSSGTRSFDVSKRLLECGHQVTMVCGAAALSRSGLSGQFLNGRRAGTVAGIHVIELELPYSNHDAILWRTWTFLRFALRSVILALTLQYDVVFATSTPLTAAIPGIAARWLRRKPFVFEVRDLWPELPRAMGILRNRFALVAMKWLEFGAYHSADSCIALSPGIAQGINRRGVSEARITMVPNGCNLDLFSPDLTHPLPKIPGLPADSFVAAFTGAHGRANGLHAVLDAAEELRKRGRSDLYFAFIGDGKEKPALVARARQRNLDNCIFADPMPKNILAQFLCCRASIGLMILDNVPAFYYGTSPNKFFDYLASGLPVLVNYPGWMAEMITAERIGVAVPPQDAIAFADALIKVAADRSATAEMGIRARQFAQREFLQTRLTQRCVSLMENVVANRAQAKVGAYRRWGKRVLDLSILLVAAPLLLPVALVVGLLVRLLMGAPVLFRQVRPGFAAQSFTLLKFRTMNSTQDEQGNLLPDEKRLTRFGQFLRRYSLDEIPQLWNVLSGEMSLVGPRPLLPQYLNRYSVEQARRHEAKPGMTGWAQVNGRNLLTWAEKFERDVWYVDHAGLWLDASILLRTIWKIVKRDGISPDGHVTVEEFTGIS